LEKLGIDAIEPPEDFWQKLNGRPGVAHGFPSTAKRAIEKTLPAKKLPYKVVRREAGHGSLGQQRFVAIAPWCGAWIAREAKATIPSSCAWLNGTVDHCQTYYETAIKSAVRSHDPYQKMVGGWLIRRLSPDANPIEIEDLPKKRDEMTLLNAMGAEAANVHLGTKRQRRKILRDLQGRKSGWLRNSAKEMAKATERDWKKYRRK